MLKNFEEFIKEGFMTRSLNRDKSGEERKENKNHTNMDSLNSVDFNISYIRISDDIFEYNGKTEFTKKEFNQIQDDVLKKFNDKGDFKYWYAPHEQNIKDYLIMGVRGKKISITEENGVIKFYNRKMKKEVIVNGERFWCNSMNGPKIWVIKKWGKNSWIDIESNIDDKETANILLIN